MLRESKRTVFLGISYLHLDFSHLRKRYDLSLSAAYVVEPGGGGIAGGRAVAGRHRLVMLIPTGIRQMPSQ